MSLHRDACHPKREFRFQIGKQLVFECPAGRRVANYADRMSGHFLSRDEVAHMPKYSAHRGSKTVNNSQVRIHLLCSSPG